MAANSLPQVHFIIGAGRSGTTLLLSMLNTSEEVLSIPEAPIALYYYQKKKNQKHFTSSDAEEWRKLGKKMRYIRQIGFDPTPIKLIQSEVHTYSDFIRASYLSLLLPGKSNEKVRYIVDKNPIYTYYAEHLLGLFPEARFVAMMRNPLAQVNSSLENRNPYNRTHSAAFHAHSWQRYADELKRLLPILQDRLLIVKYETLVSEPEATLQKICDHLGVSYRSEMHEFHKQPHTTAFKSEHELTERQKERMKNKYTHLSKPVHEGRKLSWKDKISAKDQALIADITKKGREFLHYPMNYPPASKGLQRSWSGFLVGFYFAFASSFYKMPIWLRERVRVKV